MWDVVSRLISMNPSERQKACHAPKPILLNTGEAKFPYQWQPTVVDTQMFKIGDVLITSLPGEFTTMAGRWGKAITVSLGGFTKRCFDIA
jgi:neutral ceramidase